MIQSSALPTVNALLNLTSAVILAIGFYQIKRRRNWRAHRLAMLSATVVSALFLTSYLIYHAQAGSKPYGGEGVLRLIYFLILIPHVILAGVNVPIILVTLWRAWRSPFNKHPKIARYTFPLWMYVSVTGVLVYVMLYVTDH